VLTKVVQALVERRSHLERVIAPFVQPAAIATGVPVLVLHGLIEPLPPHTTSKSHTSPVKGPFNLGRIRRVSAVKRASLFNTEYVYFFPSKDYPFQALDIAAPKIRVVGNTGSVFLSPGNRITGKYMIF
jgi:hypothetical protein